MKKKFIWHNILINHAQNSVFVCVCVCVSWCIAGSKRIKMALWFTSLSAEPEMGVQFLEKGWTG